MQQASLPSNKEVHIDSSTLPSDNESTLPATATTRESAHVHSATNSTINTSNGTAPTASPLPVLRSPSPKKHPSLTALAMSDPSPSTLTVLDTHPHLAHYIFNLLLSVKQSSSARSTSHTTHQHPLSVSSSGESDGEEDEDQSDSSAVPAIDAAADGWTDTEAMKRFPAATVGGGVAVANGRSPKGPSTEEREALVAKVVELLDDEQEEEVKELLRDHLGDLGKDESTMDQICLDCMHRHRDDASGVPYSSNHFVPTRARTRPYTPTGMPALRARTPLARPHSPAPGSTTPTAMHSSQSMHQLHAALGRVDAATSPTPPPATLTAPSSSSGYSSSGSPISSPRILNAKAATFNPSLPSPRTVSSPLSAVPPSFSPSDPWRDSTHEPPRSASPYGAYTSQNMSRTGSNRALAAPLISDPSSPFHSPLGTPMGTPTRSHVKLVSDSFASPSFSAPRPASRGVVPDDDDDDEFSPFGSGLPRLHHHEHVPSGLNSSARPFEPFGSGSSADFYSASAMSSDQSTSFDSRTSGDSSQEEDPSNAGNGMTPLDVLSSVFSTVPRSELEDALHRSGYDFEGAMAILVTQYTLPRSGASTPQRIASPRPLIGIGTAARLPVNHHAPTQGYFQQGGRTFSGGLSPGLGGTRSPGGPTRMCRYFLNGECRRSDCRFSHDLERALCRFWLRGHCAKGPNCEFMHNLPANMDPHALNAAMARMDMSSPGGSHPGTPPIGANYGPPDDFPDLLAARLNRTVGRFDPTRNRFANAVKRPAPGPPPVYTSVSGGAANRFAPVSHGSSYPPSGTESPRPLATVLPVPRPSQRLKLRPPTLLPTLQTGTLANEQYMTARAASIRLGHARNACLARAADAFRRGDGAAAKRFSREGKALNEKMLNEAGDAAQALVKDRMRDAQRAARERDLAWSNDPRDRVERGRECGAGLGVILGIASQGGDKLSSDERAECLLDLHTLHGNEGADIAGHFLVELERENYRGLAYIVVGEEKHVGNQDPLRGTSKVRLGSSVKQFLAEWGYAWNESAGVLCIDPCR